MALPIDRATFQALVAVAKAQEKDPNLFLNLYLQRPFLPPPGDQHGQHRQSNPTFHSGAPQQSRRAGDKGTDPVTPISYTTFQTIVAEDTFTVTVPHQGIRAGEVIAWRAWRAYPDRALLTSVFMEEFEWKPDEPMQGKVPTDLLWRIGVHAFKHPQRARACAEEVAAHTRLSALYECAIRSDGSTVPVRIEPLFFAIGTVALWGEIVEHELGYRAEYAKVVGIRQVLQFPPMQLPFEYMRAADMLHRLCDTYGAEPLPLTFDDEG